MSSLRSDFVASLRSAGGQFFHMASVKSKSKSCIVRALRDALLFPLSFEMGVCNQGEKRAKFRFLQFARRHSLGKFWNIS